MLQACLIYIGLSLDSFIVMMQKGAQLRNLSGKKMAGYSLLYAVISVMMLTFGYGLSNAFLGFVPDGRLEIAIACLVILSVGIWLMTKSFKKSTFEEKLDRDFTYHQLVRLALYTSVDNLFVGAGFSLLNINYPATVGLAFAVSFAAVFLALKIGYNRGASYQRTCGIIGGALMIFFSLYLLGIMVLQFVI